MSQKADYSTMFDLEAIRADIEDKKLQQRIVWKKHGCTRKQGQKMIARYGWKTCRTGPRGGDQHPEWKGGRRIDSAGYVEVWVENHPFRRIHTRYILEHRLVMEKMLGRYLWPGEVVHHIDKNKQNNDPANLRLYPNNATHLAEELKGRVPNWTPEGFQKMLRCCRKKRTRRKSKQGEQASSPSIGRSTIPDASTQRSP